MANHTNPADPAPELFKAVLDDGQTVEVDGSSVDDPVSGRPAAAVLLRMTSKRAHVLAQVLDDWSRVALVFATLRSSEVTERALAWTLDAGAVAAGHPRDRRMPGGMPTIAQRLAAVTVLREREEGLSPVQRIALVDAAAWWLSEDAGEEMARALLQVACSQATTVNFVYLALIEEPGQVS